MSDRPMSPASEAKALLEYEASKKSTALAYVLWFFLGFFGVHRFYLGESQSGLVMAILTFLGILGLGAGVGRLISAGTQTSTDFAVFVVIGIIAFAIVSIWMIVDMFLISSLTTSYNLTRVTTISEKYNLEGVSSPKPSTEAPKIQASSGKDRISLPPDFNRLVKEHQVINARGKRVTVYEFDEGSFVAEDAAGKWELFDSLDDARR